MTVKEIMTDLQAVSTPISEYTVPWVATGSHFGHELALQWIDAKEENIAAALCRWI